MIHRMSMATNVKRGLVHATINRRMRAWERKGEGGFEELFAEIRSADREQAAFWNKIYYDITDVYPDLSPNGKADNYFFFTKMREMSTRRRNRHGKSSAV